MIRHSREGGNPPQSPRPASRELRSSGPPPAGLRVAMWNIWGFSWEWERRRPLVAVELADLEPDVVVLQEARAARRPWEAGQSTPVQVAADTGIPVVEWIDAPTQDPSARMGPALLARRPPAEHIEAAAGRPRLRSRPRLSRALAAHRMVGDRWTPRNGGNHAPANVIVARRPEGCRASDWPRR